MNINLSGYDNKTCNYMENLSFVKGRNLVARRGSNKQVALVLFVCYFVVFVKTQGYINTHDRNITQTTAGDDVIHRGYHHIHSLFIHSTCISSLKNRQIWKSKTLPRLEQFSRTRVASPVSIQFVFCLGPCQTLHVKTHFGII